MASTYTENSGIELIVTGEQVGTWGDTTNVNLQIIDRLANGVGAITLSGTTHTLTTSDGSLSDGQYKVLVFGGTPSGTNTVTISPNDQQKLFGVKNNSGQTVVLTQGSGGNVSVLNGESAIVYADGTGSGAAVVNLTDKASLGLEIGADVQAYNAGLQSIAGLTTAGDKMIYTTASDTYAVADLTSFARTLLDDADAATARATLGVVIGTNVQAYDVGLTSIAGLTTAANKMLYTTALDTYAVTDLSAFARTLLDDADAATARTTLGLGTGATATIADYVPIAGTVTLTGGFDSDEEGLGTITSGTVTPEVDGANKENFKSLTNNGAFTLAPPSTSSACCIRIHVINAASAGAITTTGFDKVFDPDTYATTNAKEYFFYIDHNATRDVLTIREIV